MSARLSAGSLIFCRLRTDITHLWRRPRLGGFELPPPAGARLAHRSAAEVYIFKGGGGVSCVVVLVSLASWPSVPFASFGRVALVGLLRRACYAARQRARPFWGLSLRSAHRLSLRSVFVGWRTALRVVHEWVSPCSQPHKVCPIHGRPDCSTDTDLSAGALAARTPLSWHR